MIEQKIVVDKTDLVDIADAVRSQTGETDLMGIKEISPKIRSLSVGGNTIVQADWNQSDENAPDYVKNRTHYIENSSVEIFPETEIEIIGASASLIDYGITLLKETSPCVVTIDGVAYDTSARYAKFNAYEMWVIGNGDLIGEDLEDPHLPFAIFIDGLDDWIEFADTQNKTISLKIGVNGNVIHKIPDIYLPEPIGKIGTGGSAEIFNDLVNNIADNDYAHAEGFKTKANGYASHAENHTTKATGYASHAEGCETEAKGSYSHAENRGTQANGANSHAEGEGTIAAGKNQHVSGAYNIEDASSLVIVGNGTSNTARKNAFKLDAYGNGEFAGTIKANAILLKSSTQGSTKYFKLTIDDNGELTIS